MPSLGFTGQLRYYSTSLFLSGSGTSKKLAKRNAAAKMLSRIHDVPVDLRTSNDADPEEDTFNMVKIEFRSDYLLRISFQQSTSS